METQAIPLPEFQKALPPYFPKALTASPEKAVNEAIKENELTADDWALREFAEKLYHWVDLFNNDFFKDQPADLPVLTFERARVNNLGSYRIGRNDWGVKEQININQVYIERPLWDVLATLIHEMLHSWEYKYLPEEQRTKNWYHQKTFRLKLAEFGILCNEKGCHEGLIAEGKFMIYLKSHGVSFDDLPDYQKYEEGSKLIFPIAPKKKAKGRSKLKKWSCGCTNIRAAVQVNATCNECDNKFELQA